MIIFSNPGLLDLRAITIMGLTAKPASPSPFGQFGTGLKYAIAGIMRLGGRVELWIGGDKWEFKTHKEDFRGSQYEAISMIKLTDPTGVVLLPFTTALGSHWQPWMLFRELWANTKDENGLVTSSKEDPGFVFGLAGVTTILVECEELEEVYEHQEDYVIPADEALWEGHGLEIHSASKMTIAYQGIKASQESNYRKAACTYNITQKMSLTEDRFLASDFDARALIAKAICRCDDKQIIQQVLDANDFELDYLDFDWHDTELSEEFVSVTLAKIKAHEDIPSTARAALKRQHQAKLAEATSPPGSYAEALEIEPATRGEWGSAYDVLGAAGKLEAAASEWKAHAEFWKEVARQQYEEIGRFKEAERAMKDSRREINSDMMVLKLSPEDLQNMKLSPEDLQNIRNLDEIL